MTKSSDWPEIDLQQKSAAMGKFTLAVVKITSIQVTSSTASASAATSPFTLFLSGIPTFQHYQPPCHL
jgi:hypothetical protein